MNLAENVRILRERAGLTQAELAEKLGKGQTTIFKIENGQTLHPRFMDKLAQVLGVSRTTGGKHGGFITQAGKQY